MVQQFFKFGVGGGCLSLELVLRELVGDGAQAPQILSSLPLRGHHREPCEAAGVVPYTGHKNRMAEADGKEVLSWFVHFLSKVP